MEKYRHPCMRLALNLGYQSQGTMFSARTFKTSSQRNFSDPVPHTYSLDVYYMALAVAGKHRLRHSGLKQIKTSSSQKQIEADLETAIKSVGPEWNKATWKDAVAYLSTEKGWLLFFDNADASDLRLEDYLPSSTSGAILITTRNWHYTSYASGSHIQVGEMSETEAVELLHKVGNVQPSSNGTSVAIVKDLGMLAVAITQAGAYVFKTGELDNYLNIFRKHRAELMREPSLKGRNYDGSTYTTFDMSFGLLPPNAQEFMKICAFVHHSHIPQALFQKSIDNHFESCFDLPGYPTMPAMENLISGLKGIFGLAWDDFVFQRLIDPILQGSLIDRSTDHHEQVFYNIHPLLQTYIQDLLVPTDQDRYVLLTGQVLLGGIRPSEHDNKWYRELLPHIDNLPVRVKQAHISHAWAFAEVYRSTGRWRASLGLWKYCDIHTSETFGHRDYRSIFMKAELGAILDRCGELEEAERTKRGVLELRKAVLGPRHLDTIQAMHSLAYTLYGGGQFEEAERMGREVLELQKQILGPQHPDTVQVMHNLAPTFHDRGQFEEAERMGRGVLELRKQILGPEHPDTIQAMDNLAHTLYVRGQLQEAERMGREVLELLKEILGPEHPNTIQAMDNLAYTLYDRGQLQEAEHIRREVLQLRKRILGPLHPSTIWAMGSLADVLSSRDQLKEAETIKREVLELLEQILGPHHPDTNHAMHSLASTFRARGQLEEAERMGREVLELRKDILGPLHPYTIQAMDSLTSTFRARGQLQEAERMGRGVLELRKQILGPEHPNTIQAMDNLAYTLYDRGQLQEAEHIRREVLQLRKRILGPLHPSTIWAMGSLADVLSSRDQLKEAETIEREALELRKTEEAERMGREVLELRKDILGPWYPDTIWAMHNLAPTLGRLFQLKEAEEMMQEVVVLRKEVLGDQDPDTTKAIDDLAWARTRRYEYITTYMEDNPGMGRSTCIKFEEVERLERGILKLQEKGLGQWSAASLQWRNPHLGNPARTLIRKPWMKLWIEFYCT
ncbi:3314_t:CDS:2 [Acaulospora colombiana]|uniref:3314_t:CDS:1 n=1 Tax=Acaulospora colombiana TaxID=27376 RepID=A0ACA9M7Q9_9GLOM|nr:3314_t:CDS:2 [Acaulospora colombiana]